MAPKKILVAPLDWGLGHATRCIPLVRELQQAGHTVLIAADGSGEHILREAFPALTFIHLKGYHLKYSSTLPAWLKILLQVPKIMQSIRREKAALEKIIADHKIDVVISDNRFGLWNKNVRTVYVTHQLMIKCPPGLKLFEPLLHAWHKTIIARYDHCWIPDFEGSENLSGDLSHKYPLPSNAEFIGPLSRFGKTDQHGDAYDLCVVISGPEPSRTDFEKKIFEALKDYPGKCIVILGRPGQQSPPSKGNIILVSHLESSALEAVLVSSRRIICRAGYSSIMDLAALQKSALLVPTPGQTEQEYLAEYLSDKGFFNATKQDDLKITTDQPERIRVFAPRGSARLQQAIHKVTGSE